MNCALLSKDPTDPVDTAMLSTDEIGGLLKGVLDVLVNNEDDILADIPIKPSEVLEVGKELGGRAVGGVGAVDTGIGPTGDGLLVGAVVRPGNALVVEFIVGDGDIDNDDTEETSLEMFISDEWFVSVQR